MPHSEGSTPARLLASWQKGSRVRVAGICLVQVGEQRQPHAFRLLLRSPEDVTVVQRPSWWTLPRLLRSLAAVSLIMLAGWIWLAALGYRVREQTGIIRENIQREAAFEERARLAREFHDSLEQQLTGIRLQLDAVKTKFRKNPDEAESYLDIARSLIRHSHADARRSVWDLRANLLEKGDLPSALNQTLSQSNGDTSPHPRVIVSGSTRRLAGRVENHLLRIGQEAARNAVKHAVASEIRVELDYGPDHVALRVHDNGRGFHEASAASADAGHFGLLGMRERAEKDRRLARDQKCAGRRNRGHGDDPRSAAHCRNRRMPMKPKKKISVMVVDDHFVVRVGLKTTINMEPDMQMVAEASTAAQALDLYPKHRPDIVLMDLRLPGTNGFEATAALCRAHPEARVIVISSYEGEEDVFRALQAGARSYLPKSVLDQELAEAIRKIYAGGNYIPPSVAASLAERAHHPELSTRELEVLPLIVRGLSNKEIGARLFITEATIKLHVGNILAKLGVQDRTQASTVALQRGLVHLE